MHPVCDRVVALPRSRAVSDEAITTTSMDAVVGHILGAA